MPSPVPSRPPTLDEVAERARVSRTVASRVINNGPNVSRAKRDAVETGPLTAYVVLPLTVQPW